MQNNQGMDLPGPEHVGLKVSIRLHNENPDEALFRDVLGYLETPTSVRRRSGEIAEFDPSRIAYWKVVPSVLPQ
jgi:hypothetical protein